MKTAEQLQATITELRRDLTAINGRRKRTLLEGGDTTAVSAEMIELDQRIENAMRELGDLMESDRRKAAEGLAVFANAIADRIETRAEELIATLQPPTFPELRS